MKLEREGGAAVEVLDRLGLRSALEPRYVRGENIAQTYPFVATGNAGLGFIALLQGYADGLLNSGCGGIVG